MNTLEEYVFSMFPDAVIVERFGLRAQYKIPRNNVKSLALVFSSLEEGKTRNVYVLFFGGVGVGGYGLTQTILCKHYASLYCICQILYGLTLMGCQWKILCLVKTTKVFTLWCEQLINMTFRKKWYKEKQTNWLLSNLSTPGIYTGPYFSSGKRTHDMEEYNFSQSSLEQVQYYQWCEKKDKLFDSLTLCLY